jgi:L-histidine Nalpha-methyltransferase
MPCYIDLMSDAATATAPARQPRFIQVHGEDLAALGEELSAGLLAARAAIEPKYFYDRLGSRLFDAIVELAEYTPPRTEATILAAHAQDIAAQVGTGRTLVDLGAGNCEKAGRLFATLQPRRYVAVDISVEHLQDALRCLQREHPLMDMIGVGLDFSRSLRLPSEVGDSPRTLFYPGSSIGNFKPREAVAFLRRARVVSPGGNLLIGIDLVKERAALEAAYDDALGVTAAFNLNVLLHVNRLIGSDFDVRDWRHVALFNEAESRIEMHLEARRDVDVRWPGAERRFVAGERIHTENSYKYRVEDFDALLRAAGFTQTTCWSEEQGGFAVFCAAA